MNERIKELVGQAKFMAEETLNKQISKNAELDAFAEKFAELIIQECINAVAPTRHHEAFSENYIGGVEGLELLKGVVKKINKQFGL